MTLHVVYLLSSGRLQEAEWLMHRSAPSPLDLTQLAQRLGTQLAPELFLSVLVITHH